MQCRDTSMASVSPPVFSFDISGTLYGDTGNCLSSIVESTNNAFSSNIGGTATTRVSLEASSHNTTAAANHLGGGGNSQQLEAAAALRLNTLDLQCLSALLRRYSRDPRIHRLLRLPASSAAALSAYRNAAAAFQKQQHMLTQSGGLDVKRQPVYKYSAHNDTHAIGMGGKGGGGGGSSQTSAGVLIAIPLPGGGGASGNRSGSISGCGNGGGGGTSGGGGGGGGGILVSAAAAGLRREMVQLYSSVDALLSLYERQALQLYSRSRPQMLLLQQELQATDTVLQRLESRLITVRDELQHTSANIEAVEERSLLLGQRMDNREETSIVLNAFLQQITLEPKLVYAICHAHLGRTAPSSATSAVSSQPSDTAVPSPADGEPLPTSSNAVPITATSATGGGGGGGAGGGGGPAPPAAAGGVGVGVGGGAAAGEGSAIISGGATVTRATAAKGTTTTTATPTSSATTADGTITTTSGSAPTADGIGTTSSTTTGAADAAAAGGGGMTQPLDHAAFVAALHELNKKIEHAKQPGMQRLKCAATSLPQLQRLLACALSRISSHLSSKLSLLRQPRTNIFILQQNDLLRCADLYAFLLDHQPSTAFAFKNLYTRTIAQVYVNLFRVYIHQLRRLQQQQQLPQPPVAGPNTQLHVQPQPQQQQTNVATPSLGVAGAAAAAVAAAASLLPGNTASGATALTEQTASPSLSSDARLPRGSSRLSTGGGAEGVGGVPSLSPGGGGGGGGVDGGTTGGAAGAVTAAGTSSLIASAKQVVGFFSRFNTSGPSQPLPLFSSSSATPPSSKTSTFCLGDRHIILRHLDDDPVIATPWASSAGRLAAASSSSASFTDRSSRTTTATAIGGGGEGGGTPPGNLLVPHPRISQLATLYEEQVFRSHQKLLLDTATREFLFLTQFFLDAGLDCPYTRLFQEALRSSMVFLLGVIENAVRSSSDAVGLLLMLRINHHNRLTMRRRKLSCLNGYLAQVREILHAALRAAMESCILWLKRASPQAAIAELPAEVRFQPHFVSRQFAELVSALEYVRRLPLLPGEQRMHAPTAPAPQQQQQSDFGRRKSRQERSAADAEATETDDESLVEDFYDPALLKALVDAALDWIYRMAATFPTRRERAIFLINNYDLLLHVFHQRNVLPEACAAVEKHLYEQISVYVEEQQRRHFGRLIAAVATIEMASKDQLHATEASSSTALPQLPVAAPLPESVLVELEAAATEFTAEWKQRLSATQAESVAMFSTFPNSVEILKQSMTQLLLLHARLEQAIAATYASAKSLPTWTKHIVPVNSILSEIRAISRNLS